MLTDSPPRNAKLGQFTRSDQIKALELPPHGDLIALANSIEAAMTSGTTADVRRASMEFLDSVARFYKVPLCGVRVLQSRPLRVRENWASELFGDYRPESMRIRVWMRTAIKKDVTSFGTFLSTLCHEFCHHLDFQRFGLSIPGIPAAFMNGRLCSIIMRGRAIRNGWSGCR
jgi:hypothetical protein